MLCVNGLVSREYPAIQVLQSAASRSVLTTQHTLVHGRFYAVPKPSLLPPDTTALRYSTIASRSPADSTVALPLATCRHCFSSGQMPLCETP